MYNIGLNKVITLTRGDTFEYKYMIDLGMVFDNENHSYCHNYYTMQEKDHLYFALMEPNQRFDEATIKRIYGIDSFEEDHINIKLSSDDTWYLNTGKYYYTIKLEKYIETVDGVDKYNVITTQPNTLFFLI